MNEVLNTKYEVERKFNFLNTEYGFKGPFEWNVAYEREYTYVNQQYYLNVGFDGGFMISVGKTKQLIPELSTGELTLEDIGYKNRESRDLILLLSKKEKNHFEMIKDPIESLSLYSEIVQNNPEILKGRWYKFSVRYKILIYIRSMLFSKTKD